jgi:hypothetical protein
MEGQMIVDQLTTGALVVYALEYLKRSRLVPWITTDTKGLNRFLAALGAAAGTAGIHFQFDTAGGTLQITGLLLPNLMTFAWQFLQQWVCTQAIYAGLVEPNRKRDDAPRFDPLGGLGV